MVDREILDFIQETDVKFIKLFFCDLLGIQKSISVAADQAQQVLSNGLLFDASSIIGFSAGSKSDLYLVPDVSTMQVLPWRPASGRVVRFFCDIKNPDGSDFMFDTRALLRKTVKRLEKNCYLVEIGMECEFYLFKTDINGDPTMIPYDDARCFDIAPLDKCENIRREMCLTLSEMGFSPEVSHHESGPGQNEIDFYYRGSLSGADTFMAFKSAIKAIAAKNGAFASFMPKPFLDKSGSGLHLNISLSKNGEKVFPGKNESLGKLGDSFVAGILSRSREISAYVNSNFNSYQRLGEFEAPLYVSWSNQNRSQLIRIPSANKNDVCMEVRNPDPALNPYLAFNLLINAGLEGIENNMSLPDPVDENLYDAEEDITSKLERLPVTFDDALNLSRNSEFVNRTIGRELNLEYFNCKSIELRELESAADKEELIFNNYFRRI
ncbi:MAG: glutamine synthetase family protein [Christensenellaceae bacterium]|jgi:glutamine synthetase|nr:glutamine synthetase family protein [Christensenellaceae bacterium]